MSYPISTETLGILVKERVLTITIPRAEFLGAAHRALGEVGLEEVDEVRSIVWPIALSVPQFPLNEWIDATRGCGCLVGESLVAAGLDRAKLANMFGNGTADITGLAEDTFGVSAGRGMFLFGVAVDREVRNVLDGSFEAAAAIIEAENRRQDVVVLIED